MGRIYNPDYFKVGAGTAGSGVSKGGRFAEDHARYSDDMARLHRSQARRDWRPPPAQRTRRDRFRPAEVPHVPTSSAELAALRVDAVHVDMIHTDKPRHGKKRRSSRKRHEAALRKAEAAEPSKPVPPVAELRDRPARRAEQAAPNTLPRQAQTWISLARSTASMLRALAVAPFSVARSLARLRRLRT